MVGQGIDADPVEGQQNFLDRHWWNG